MISLNLIFYFILTYEGLTLQLLWKYCEFVTIYCIGTPTLKTVTHMGERKIKVWAETNLVFVPVIMGFGLVQSNWYPYNCTGWERIVGPAQYLSLGSDWISYCASHTGLLFQSNWYQIDSDLFRFSKLITIKVLGPALVLSPWTCSAIWI